MSQRKRSVAARLSAALVIVGLAGVSAAAVWRSSAPVPAAAGAGNCGLLSIKPVEVTLTADATGADRKFSFTLRNDGSCPVSIADVRTTCGCTVAALPAQRTLLPGDETSLQISAHVPKYGERNVRITVDIDSAAQREVTATALLKGGEPETPRLFNMPQDVEVEGVRGGKFTHAVVLIATEKADDAPWLKAIEIDADWVRAAPPVIEAHEDAVPGIVRRSYRFEISGEFAGEESTTRRARLDVTSGEGTSVASFSLAANAVPAVSVIPQAVYLRSATDGGTASQTVVLRPVQPEFRLQVEVRPAPDEWLQVTAAHGDEAGAVHSLKCEVRSDQLANAAAAAIVQSTIIVQTNHPDCPEIRIPVYCRR